jgi:hypothetical protein
LNVDLKGEGNPGGTGKEQRKSKSILDGEKDEQLWEEKR